MTKKEYMKKLAYQLRRLPKEDFDKAMDYFEEYFEDVYKRQDNMFSPKSYSIH